jgi:hypothetical protein
MVIQHAVSALADPVTRARIDNVIREFRARSVPLDRTGIVAAAANAGLDATAADVLAEAVEERLRERCAP